MFLFSFLLLGVVFVYCYRVCSCSMSICRCSLLVITTELVGGEKFWLPFSRGLAATIKRKPPTVAAGFGVGKMSAGDCAGANEYDALAPGSMGGRKIVMT